MIHISIIGGVVAFPSLAGWHASGWALEGITESLTQKVAAFGIMVTLIELDEFDTDWAGSSAVTTAPLPQYDTAA